MQLHRAGEEPRAKPGLSGSGCWMSRRGIGRIEASECGISGPSNFLVRVHGWNPTLGLQNWPVNFRSKPLGVYSFTPCLQRFWPECARCVWRGRELGRLQRQGSRTGCSRRCRWDYLPLIRHKIPQGRSLSRGLSQPNKHPTLDTNANAVSPKVMYPNIAAYLSVLGDCHNGTANPRQSCYEYRTTGHDRAYCRKGRSGRQFPHCTQSQSILGQVIGRAWLVTCLAQCSTHPCCSGLDGLARQIAPSDP